MSFTSTDKQTQPTVDMWAIVEIMGHDRYIGRVTEQTIGGHSFVRVDVPPAEGRPAFTKMFGGGSIYAITPISESLACELAAREKRHPVNEYDVPAETVRRITERSNPVRGSVGSRSHSQEESDFFDDEDDDEDL